MSSGLRDFSRKVCEKVQSHGTTTYTEVAKELVEEHAANGGEGVRNEGKNIRRRVYDALNVLEALGLIKKDRKDKGIVWIGTSAIFDNPLDQKMKAPTAPASNYGKIHMEYEKIARETHELREQLNDSIAQYSNLARLAENNPPREHSDLDADNIIPLPFFLVEAPRDASVDQGLSSDERTTVLTLDTPFTVYGEDEILPILRS